jgi:hypothetical protein
MFLIDVIFVETQITARNLAEVCLENTLTKFCVAKFNHLLHPSVHKQQLGTFSCYQRRIKLVVQETTVRLIIESLKIYVKVMRCIRKFPFVASSFSLMQQQLSSFYSTDQRKIVNVISINIFKLGRFYIHRIEVCALSHNIALTHNHNIAFTPDHNSLYVTRVNKNGRISGAVRFW